MIIPDDIAETAIALKDQYFDLRGLNAYSDLKIPTLRDHIRSGRLPCFKVKGKILVKRSEFDAWMEGFRYKKNQNPKEVANEVLRKLKSRKSD